MMLGCFNRPWNRMEFEDALATIREAGYEGLGLMKQQGAFLIRPDSTPDEMASLAAQIQDAGLTPLVALSPCPLDRGVDAVVDHYVRTLDNALRAGVAQVMSTGGPREYRDAFVEAARRIAEHASGVGARFVLKTHGKLSSTGADCRRILDEVGESGFGIWYDAGNVLHYDNVRPESDVENIAGRVVGICVKDCLAGGDRPVMITPGDGDAALEQVYRTLKGAGFDGPAFVECLAGDTTEELAAEARRARAFLQRTFGLND